MNRIREILLTQHIGAIMIGLILAQGVLLFVNSLVQVGTTYWALQQARGILTQGESLPWHNLVSSMFTVVLDLMICLALIRWLYSDQADVVVEDSSEGSEQ